MPPHRVPKPGRYGTHPVMAVSGIIGGANYLGGASPLTANTTTRFYLQHVSGPYYFLGGSLFVETRPADSDGTVLAYIRKNRAGVFTVLTAALDLETITNGVNTDFVLATGLSEGDRTLIEGDELELIVVNNSAAIDTQPVKMYAAGELALKN